MVTDSHATHLEKTDPGGRGTGDPQDANIGKFYGQNHGKSMTAIFASLAYYFQTNPDNLRYNCTNKIRITAPVQ